MYDSQLGAPMLMVEFGTIMDLLRRRCLYTNRLRGVKVTPVIDLHSQTIGPVTVEWMDGSKIFDMRDSPRPLYERMLDWLHEPDKIEGEE